MTPTQQAYKAGESARHEHKGKLFCPYGEFNMRLRHWWLAGWHDADIALTARKTGL